MGYIVILISLLMSVMADDKCPDIKPVKNFNFTAMGDGVWYDLARYYEQNVEKGSVGNRYIFTKEDNVVHFTVYEIRDGKLNSFNGTLKVAENAGDTGQLIYDVNEEGGIIVYLDVVDIEYDKFLILYYCAYDKNTQKRTDFAWIAARKIGGDKETTAKVKKFLQSSGLIDEKKLIWEKVSDHNMVSALLKNKN